MTKAVILSALAGVFLFGWVMAAFAGEGAEMGEFDELCAMGLALGKDIQTDCSISETINGKKYCFGNETARTIFMKDPEGNLAKAREYMSSKKM